MSVALMIAVSVQVFDVMVMSGFQSCVVVVVTMMMCRSYILIIAVAILVSVDMVAKAVVISIMSV